MQMPIKWFKRPPVKVEIIKRDPFRLSIQEWRADLTLCVVAQRALANPDVRLMLDCIRNSHVGNWVAMPGLSLEERAIMQAQAQGYGMALNDLESLAVHAKPQEALEATFEPPNPVTE